MLMLRNVTLIKQMLTKKLQMTTVLKSLHHSNLKKSVFTHLNIKPVTNKLELLSEQGRRNIDV